MSTLQKITTFLMFDGKAEEAMRFYTSLFADSEIRPMTWYGSGDAGTEPNRFANGRHVALMHAQSAAEILGAAGVASQLAAGGARDSTSWQEAHIADG